MTRQWKQSIAKVERGVGQWEVDEGLKNRNAEPGHALPHVERQTALHAVDQLVAGLLRRACRGRFRLLLWDRHHAEDATRQNLPSRSG